MPQPKGPPSGGNGGKGGSVYIVATDGVHSLSHIPRRIRADAGASGSGSWLAGKRGDDVTLRVPLGTVVKEMRIDKGVEEIDEDDEDAREDALAALDEEEREREELRWAWDANMVRLKEAEKRDKRWRVWRKKRDQAHLTHVEPEPWVEEDLIELEPHKEDALTRVRRDLFVMYPGDTDLAEHPSFLQTENQILSSMLEQRQLLPQRKRSRYGRKRRRRDQQEVEEPPMHLDLTHATPLESPILLARGGEPGYGNSAFVTTTDRSPKYATRGAVGTTLRLSLELKTLSDVGLVGFPNAGKSTVLRALTHSNARVASFAFTTLNPHKGTCVMYSDGSSSAEAMGSEEISDTPLDGESFSAKAMSQSRVKRTDDGQEERTETMRFTITDNPGLVRDASHNVGLGHAFLRHIERCASLVIIVDINDADPAETVAALQHELREYSRVRGIELALDERVKGVVVNKADLFATDDKAAEGQARLAAIKAQVGADTWVLPTSAKKRENVRGLAQKLARTVLDARAEAESDTL